MARLLEGKKPGFFGEPQPGTLSLPIGCVNWQRLDLVHVKAVPNLEFHFVSTTTHQLDSNRNITMTPACLTRDATHRTLPNLGTKTA
jgi:hypothetical protein